MKPIALYVRNFVAALVGTLLVCELVDLIARLLK